MNSPHHIKTGRRSPSLVALASAIALSGCSATSQTPANDTTLVMRSLLSTLSADGHQTCIDRHTRGQPLAIFRTMMAAPEPARRRLAWFAPKPLRPYGMLSGQQLFDEQIRPGHVVLAKPQQSSRPLSNLLQGQLDAAAGRLSLYQDQSDIAIDEWPAAPRATVHWWVRNRLDRGCTPAYTVSNPVVAKNLAFVSVTGGHQGTTYAFSKKAATWSPIAQWTNWIY